MYAIRQLQSVENGQVIVQIPADFPADQVEVIVLPSPMVNGKTELDNDTNDSGIEAIQHILTMDTSRFTQEQMVAYQRTCEQLHQWLTTRKMPPFGLFSGLIKVADDFDAPLPDDIVDLFYGSETDAYGISLPR